MAKENDPLSDHPFPLNLSLDRDSGTDSPLPALGLDDLASPTEVPPQPAEETPQPDLRDVQEMAQLIELAEDESAPAAAPASEEPPPEDNPELDEPLEPVVIQAPTQGELVAIPKPKKRWSIPPAEAVPAESAEVSDLRPTTKPGSIELSWVPPAGAKGIEVWRQPDSPPERGEGVLVDHVTLTEARDPGLYNGKRYGYRVVAVFDGPDGEPVYSVGETCSACPGDPPPVASPDGEMSLGQMALYGGIALGVFLVVGVLGTSLGLFSTPARPEKPATVAQVKETPPAVQPARAIPTPPRKAEPPRKLEIKTQEEPVSPAPAPEPAPASQPRTGQPAPTPRVVPAPRPRPNPTPARPSVAPLEGEEALLLGYPPADQQQWEQAWRRNLKVHVTLKMSSRNFGQTKALPTVIGLHGIRLENQSPCLIRVVGGPAKNLESTSRKRLEIAPERSLWLSDPSNHPATMSIDLRMQAERGGAVAAVRRGPLCTIEVVPSNGQEPLRLVLEYSFTVNRDNEVLSARYILSGAP